MADVITRLKVESSEYNNKVKRAAQELLNMETACRKVNGTLSMLEKEQKQFVQSLGNMQTVSKDVRGQIGELSNAYITLRTQYNRLTEAEKKGDFGKALNASLGRLKERIGDSRKELQAIQQEISGSKFGQLGGIIDGIGKKMGLNANVTELLTSKTARLTAVYGGLATGIVAAASQFHKLNTDFSRQDSITTVTTGLKGDKAVGMTNSARAISDTYNVDFREVINAANTLMTQFGKTGEDSIKLIRDGMQGMIRGDGPKLLNMIQQYAPSFRDAGIAADQLVAIIHNSEGGIFTDQNMNAIVMGIKNIRLMTSSTSEALAKLGIDGRKMSQELNDGTLTIFQALKQVAEAVQGVNSNSQAAGEVMQQVFGRQGAMAGTKLGEAIATLNTNLQETKKQTGELGEANDELCKSYEELNIAIREAFGYDGWEQMAIGIKSKLLSALADVISALGVIRQGLEGLLNDATGKAPKGSGGINHGYNFGREISKKISAGKTVEERQRLYDQHQRELQNKLASTTQDKWYRDKKGNDVNVAPDKKDVIHDNIRYQQAARYLQQNRDLLINGKPAQVTPTIPTHTSRSGTTAKAKAKAEKEEKEKELTIQQQIAKLEEEAYNTGGEGLAVITAEIKLLDEELQRRKAIRDQIHGINQEKKKDPAPDLATSAGLSKYISDAKSRQGAAALGSAGYDFLGEKLSSAETLQTAIRSALENGVKAADISSATEEWRNLLGSNLIDTDAMTAAMQEALAQIESLINDKDLKIKFRIDTKQMKEGPDKVNESVKELAKNASKAGGAMSTLGGAISSLEDPTAKVAGLVMQAIGNVALSFSQALATPKDPWSWIAFAAAGTATMISTIAAIHNATGYANGGIVDGSKGGFVTGNSFSGDNIGNVRLDAGEVVLNRAMQSNLANSIERSDNGPQQLHALIRAEDIELILTNRANRIGKSEYLKIR